MPNANAIHLPLDLAKRELRQAICEKKKRFFSSVDIDMQHAISEKILRKIALMPTFARAKTVLCYYSLPDELYTHSFVEWIAANKIVLLPKVVGNDLTLHRYAGKPSLVKGAYGILEPSEPEIEDYSAPDIVIVPGLAFDMQGSRLGRGRGYYDRLFSQKLKHDIQKIGVCYPFQIQDNVPVGANDIRMDAVISTC